MWPVTLNEQRRDAMKAVKGFTYNDRLSTQAEARKAMLEKFKARPSADDPDVMARQAERIAIAEARAEREAKRKAEREAEAARIAAEKKAEQERLAAEKLAREIAEKERQEREERERAERDRNLEADRKAARDARYAARKARNRRI
jgi:membrane protein involved in colicin uptake